MKKKILYVVLNDGSDMRVCKEINTLSNLFEVYFIGVGHKTETSFVINKCKSFTLIQGNYRSPFVILKLILTVIRSRFKIKINSVHIVDEQLYLFLFPFLIGKKVILDVFDSFFLKLNKPKEKWVFFKKILYFFPKTVVVTDENRFQLLPKFVHYKSKVIPNVPYLEKYNIKETDKEKVYVCYFGTLVQNRGSEFLMNLLKENSFIKVIAAGWIADDYTKEFLKLENVSYLGVKAQKEINGILAKRGDYLLAIYPTNNMNNINASPNKIYDSIHTQTPIIINKKIKVSEFVIKNKIGYVVDDFIPIDFRRVGLELLELKRNFTFNNTLKKKYCWENYQDILVKIHEN